MCCVLVRHAVIPEFQSTHLPLWQWVSPLQASYPTLVSVCGSASIRGVQGDSVCERDVLAFLWASLAQQQSCTVHSPALKNQTSSEVRHKRVKKAVPVNFIYLTRGINISEPECGVYLFSPFPFFWHWFIVSAPKTECCPSLAVCLYFTPQTHKSSTTKHVKCYKSYKSSKSVRNLELKLVPSRAGHTDGCGNGDRYPTLKWFSDVDIQRVEWLAAWLLIKSVSFPHVWLHQLFLLFSQSKKRKNFHEELFKDLRKWSASSFQKYYLQPWILSSKWLISSFGHICLPFPTSWIALKHSELPKNPLSVVSVSKECSKTSRDDRTATCPGGVTDSLQECKETKSAKCR